MTLAEWLWPKELSLTPDGHQYWAMVHGKPAKMPFAVRPLLPWLLRHSHPQTPVLVASLVSLACISLLGGWPAVALWTMAPWAFMAHRVYPVLPDAMGMAKLLA